MCSKNTLRLAQQGAAWSWRFPSARKIRETVFEFSAVVSPIGQEQASKSEGSSGCFFWVCQYFFFVGCFIFQEYDGRILKVFAFFQVRMKGNLQGLRGPKLLSH